MPRCVRNFWIATYVDGKQREVATGPRAADGGFSTEIYMRDKGGVMTAVRISGREVNGKLVLDLYLHGATDVTPVRITTER